MGGVGFMCGFVRHGDEEGVEMGWRGVFLGGFPGCLGAFSSGWVTRLGVTRARGCHGESGTNASVLKVKVGFVGKVLVG